MAPIPRSWGMFCVYLWGKFCITVKCKPCKNSTISLGVEASLGHVIREALIQAFKFVKPNKGSLLGTIK